MIEKYSDLTIEKYQQLREIDVDCSEEDIMVQIMSILSDMDEDAIMNLPLVEFNAMVRKTAFLKEKPKLTKRLPNTLTIHNQRFTLLKDASKMSAGAYIDYKSYIKKPEDIEKNLALILTTVLIPEGAKAYADGYDTFELAEEFKKYIGIELALSISNFFFTQLTTYSKNTLTYLELVLKKMSRSKTVDKETMEKMKEAQRECRLLRDSLIDGSGLTGL